MKKYAIMLSILFSILNANDISGEAVFKKYCWGCHHQTSEAFGPSFKEIAAKRTYDEINAYIIAPEGMYEAFGYKRTAMTKFNLSEQERDAVAKYILSYKAK